MIRIFLVRNGCIPKNNDDEILPEHCKGIFQKKDADNFFKNIYISTIMVPCIVGCIVQL
jgi:hypothetical protein